MTRIKDINPINRPREKFLKYGAKRLSIEELIAIILCTGNKTKNSINLAKEITSKFSENLKHAKIAELSSIKGIGNIKAIEILSAIELGKRIHHPIKICIQTPKQIWKEMKNIRYSRKEHLIAFYLNTSNHIIKRETISIGTINQTITHPREVFEPAIRYNANAIILSHNHPSSDVTASNEDIKTTKMLISSGELLGIPILDHIIVTKSQYTSIKENFPWIFHK